MESKKDYIDQFKNFDEHLDELEGEIEEIGVFDQKAEKPIPKFNFWPRIRHYTLMIETLPLFGELFNLDPINRNLSALRKSLACLTNDNIGRSEDDVVGSIEELRNRLWPMIKEEVQDKASRINADEERRLDEALHNYKSGCYFSTVAMSVTAIESRMRCGMKEEGGEEIPIEYGREFDELTLGQLIDEYRENKEEYNFFVPARFNNIFDLVNDYRIFSVHPKDVIVQKGDARSVLTNSFNLLIHEEMDY